MTEYNIFIENTFTDYEIDEIKIYNNIKKITEYLFSMPDVYNNSCLKDVEYKTVCFDIVLTNNEEIQRINYEYRQKNSATDVITFAIFADSPQEERFIFDGEVNLGEIIVSINKIEEQAKENDVSFESELYYILSHGVLHLLGFDHQNDSDYNFMVQTQNKAKAIVL